MPLYEYQCDNCGDRFEAMQKFADAPLTVHEKCGGGPVIRLLSVPALQFKGSGFYINDYAKSGSSSANNGETKKKSESGESSGGKETSGAKTESSTSSEKTSSTKSSDSSSSSTTSKPVSDKK
jgi:putative FmdB family regulatory protein